ncbi:hypothetical protein K501DRAFT_280423 [Backusella circina FSU 941]|nr:hypothetical protein K501DRAFT_280423 [Backusella circina FSU 941]
MVDIKRIPSLSTYGISDDMWLLSCKFTFQTRQKKTRTSHGVNFIHDPLLSKGTDFTMAEHEYLSIRGLLPRALFNANEGFSIFSDPGSWFTKGLDWCIVKNVSIVYKRVYGYILAQALKIIPFLGTP